MIKLQNLVAYLGHLAKEKQISNLTHLKLQKLLYYLQAWNLIMNGEPLFWESIEAWVHGPVVRSVYTQFRDQSYDVLEMDSYSKIPEMAEAEKQVISEVVSVYGKLSADYLEKLSHHEYPWLLARGDKDSSAKGDSVISLASMASYYRQFLEEKQPLKIARSAVMLPASPGSLPIDTSKNDEINYSQILIDLANASWDFDYIKFCQVCGFHPDRPVSELRWDEFKQLTFLLNQFDIELLVKLARAVNDS